MDMSGKNVLPLSSFCLWLSLGGLVVSGLSYYAGVEHLEAMAAFTSSFNHAWSSFGSSTPSNTSQATSHVQVMPGLGILICGVAYLVAAFQSRAKKCKHVSGYSRRMP